MSVCSTPGICLGVIVNLPPLMGLGAKQPVAKINRVAMSRADGLGFIFASLFRLPFVLSVVSNGE